MQNRMNDGSNDLSRTWISPDWPAPANVRAYVTTKQGGKSQHPYSQLNLADHVGDKPVDVLANRAILRVRLQLPDEPKWLVQQHTTNVVELKPRCSVSNPADAAYTLSANVVAVVQTADCLPVLLCDTAGTVVAAVHAGWRGLAAGVLRNTVLEMLNRSGISSSDLLVWLGPAIGPSAFEVGEEVLEAFAETTPQAEQAFTPGNSKTKWYADIYHLAKIQLAEMEVHRVCGGEYCTYKQSELFYSYRRDKVTGRMASVIWMAE